MSKTVFNKVDCDLEPVHTYTPENNDSEVVDMEEVEYKILQKISDIYEAQQVKHYVGDDIIAEALEMGCQEVSDFLDMMKEDGFVQLSTSVDGCSAMLTSKGRLMLSHPDYMQKKGYAIACLNVLEEAVTKDTHIPEERKIPSFKRYVRYPRSPTWSA
ncbi:MAG: hypothetical protein NTY37_08290 [Methanothrix sp.]|nr:hypothetical protein [Methanothrix sp.]